ncbi:MAG: hypothetical protein JST01_28285 [Cyanobacteria bacterium SZAS TMP-1]|nr:hypothetical protein [Cyanobacteria bacterium SZAS TMP-1]
MKDNRISITKSDLQEAAKNGSMSPLDVDPLWQALSKSQTNVQATASQEASRFDIAQLAWYAGGVLVMIAMTWFMARAGEVYGAGGVTTLSLLYTAGFAGLGFKLFKDGIKTPAAVLYTLAVLMTPVTLSSGLEAFHLDKFLNSSSGLLTIELTTAALGLFTLTRVKSSLLSAPVYGSFWLISMTAAWMLTGTGDGFIAFFEHVNQYNLVSMIIGLVILVSAVRVDSLFGREPGSDYSWWGYLFGVAAFWIPLSLLDSGGELGKLAYFGVNILLMVSSVIVGRRVLLLAGAIGSTYYVGHLLVTFFANSLMLPFVLIAAGVGVIFLGIKYRQHQAALEGFVLSLVPESVRRFLPRRS